MGKPKHISEIITDLRRSGILDPLDKKKLLREGKMLKIKDLWGAAFVKAKGVKLVDVLREGRSVYFLFGPEARDVIFDYENGVKISSILYKSAIDDLKSIIYDFEFV